MEADELESPIGSEPESPAWLSEKSTVSRASSPNPASPKSVKKGTKTPKEKKPLPADECGKQPPEEWIEAVLEIHNDYRLKHWTPPLVWSEECFDHARMQADKCARKEKLSYGCDDSISGRHGQNLSGPHSRPALAWGREDAKRIIKDWYSEMKFYNFNEPPAPNSKTEVVDEKTMANGETTRPGQRNARNFTQMIWFGTTSVGMAISKCGKYCVANYFPPGGRMAPLPAQNYRSNVHPLTEGKAPWQCRDPWPLPPAPNYWHLIGDRLENHNGEQDSGDAKTASTKKKQKDHKGKSSSPKVGTGDKHAKKEDGGKSAKPSSPARRAK